MSACSDSQVYSQDDIHAVAQFEKAVWHPSYVERVVVAKESRMQVADTCKEVQIIANLDHPNIVKVVAIARRHGHILLFARSTMSGSWKTTT